MTNKIYQLTLNNLPLTLTLTPPPSWGYCANCFKNKEIRIISQHPNQIRRKFCSFCALDKLDKLWDYIDKHHQIIDEIRSFLLKGSFDEDKKEVFDCYE